MIKVNVAVGTKSWNKKITNTKEYFNKKLVKINKIINFFNKKNITFTIFLTNSINIKKINKKFRKKNKATDVLSFPFYLKKDLKDKKDKNIYIGDIAISYEIIKNRAKKGNFLLEFDKVWVHGLLHLIGYDHTKNKDYYIMSRIEKKILTSII